MCFMQRPASLPVEFERYPAIHCAEITIILYRIQITADPRANRRKYEEQCSLCLSIETPGEYGYHIYRCCSRNGYG